MPFFSKSELQNLISLGKTRQAINNLLDITKSLEDNELLNEVILQSSKFEEYQKQGRKGISTFENQDISISRIDDALLQIINKLPDDLKKTPIERVDNQKSKLLWKFVALLAALLAVLTVFVIINKFNLKENPHQKPENKAIQTNGSLSQNSIFKAEDENHFNVLIIRFEDYIAGEDTYCIGRAVEEHLNVIAANEDLSLSLKNIYVSDSILPPKSQEEAIGIQERHHSDLIIYGLARQVEQNCAGAEVCFRYRIAEKMIAKVAFGDDIKSAKHDSDYKQTSPMEIEEGKLQIDSLSMKYWISSLVNIKANKVNEAISDLADLTNKDIELLSDSEKSKRYLTAGKTYYDLKEYEKAITNFEKAIELDPNNVSAHYNRGNAYGNLKEYQRAIDDYDKTIQLDPDDAYAYNSRGVAFSSLEKHQKAITDFDKAIQLDMDYSSTYTYRGVAFFMLEEYQKAIDDLDKGILLDPDDAFAHFNRGLAYLFLEEYQRAIEDFDKCIQLNPDDARAYYSRGIIYYHLKEYQRAIDNFNKAIQLNPVYANAYNNLGYALIKQEKFSLAKKNLEKSKELDPDNSFVYKNLAYYYALQNQEELAFQNLEKAIQLGYEDIEWLKEESSLASIRASSRFERLLNAIQEKE